jgi:multimeric flavodoxin WrbA
MRILGLIGSDRPLGNTELLVTEIAKAAIFDQESVQVKLLRITDLRLDFCRGCMQCAFEEGGLCSRDDDMEFLLGEFKQADALILGAPAYTLLPPGPIKLIADRLIMYLARSEWTAKKPAVTVGLAGLPRWSEMLLPLLNCTVLCQGFRLVDSLLAYGAGPGSVLLDAGNVERAQLAGKRLGQALQGEPMEVDFGPGKCPVCGADFFRATPKGIECPLCLLAGKVENGELIFDESKANRWDNEALRHHFTDWIQRSGESYLDQLPDIRKLQRPYKKRPFEFLSPPSKQSSGA